MAGPRDVVNRQKWLIGNGCGRYTGERYDVRARVHQHRTQPECLPSAAIAPSQWPPTDEQIRQFASTGFSRAGHQIPQQLVDEVRCMTYHSLTATMQGIRDYRAQQSLPDRLTPLGKPLLVIFGEDDRRWRSSSAADYRAVPGAKVELLPGLGHSPMLEDPPRTAEPLLAFTAIHAVRADSLP